MAAWGAILGAAGSVYGGIASYMMSKDQSKLLENQGTLAKEDYFRQAEVVRDQGYRFKQQQAMDYISSGVEIQGTALLVLQETTKMANTEAKWLEYTGGAIEQLQHENAKIKEREGKAALISGILGGAFSMTK